MTVREAIAQAYRGFEEAFLKGDAEALSQIYTDDAEWLVPEAPPIRGRQAIAQAWKNLIGSGGNTVRVMVGEIEEAGNWAYEVGAFEARSPNGAVLNSGKYIVIWKRLPTGEWKTHRDIFNWDIPPGRIDA